MNEELKRLYQELIMDHNNNPRNFYEMEDADFTIEGFNPMCGDHIKLFAKISDEGIIEKVSFIGEGCAISKASASMMTEAIQGRTKQEAEKMFERFHDLVTGKLHGEEAMEELGKLSVFAGIQDLPARVKCATMAWHTLKNLLDGKQEETIF